MKSFINSADADLSQYGLSGGAIAGDLVFAGAMALDVERLERLPAADTIADETRICIDELGKTLKQAGCTLRDLVKVNCYLSEDSFRGEFWATWDGIFAAIDAKPIRLTQVAGLAGGCRVELDGIAVRPGQ